MPLCCLNREHQPIYSFRLNGGDWDALAEKNRKEHHLRMACCDGAVTLKRSPYGTQFFAHARRRDGCSGPESAEHLLAKEIIARAVESSGWQARVEHRHPAGNWTSDVVALRDGQQIVFEVQFSPQTPDETKRRDERYRADGVECVWLLKAPKTFSPAKVVHPPLFPLTMEDARGYVGPWKQPLEQFVASVLDRSTVIVGPGVALQCARYRANQLALNSMRKVQAVIAAAGEAVGWRSEIDARYAPWENAPNGAPYKILRNRYAGWTIGVLLKRDDKCVAVHCDDSGWRPEVANHYRKIGIAVVTVVFKRKQTMVSVNAGDGTHDFNDASRLDAFIRTSLARFATDV